MASPGDALALSAMAARASAAAEAEGWILVRAVSESVELASIVIDAVGAGTPAEATARYAQALGFATDASRPGTVTRWLLVPWCDVPYTKAPSLAQTRPARNRAFNVSYAKLDRHQLAV
eukprot:CAMPEP_0174844752 /NCGR_PEP_ID=MMETSP1114-20130205/11301_1 /TAXON_ID=312471 /ORGANISM="Neobodo designis, Strain CCAP 1951/1" /LENGTH=118 /DNA_ID=CAMNT_0016078997 /DNA_START=44 /DNA_END=397 /DNA_ORIENTATION=+